MLVGIQQPPTVCGDELAGELAGGLRVVLKDNDILTGDGLPFALNRDDRRFRYLAGGSFKAGQVGGRNYNLWLLVCYALSALAFAQEGLCRVGAIRKDGARSANANKDEGYEE